MRSNIVLSLLAPLALTVVACGDDSTGSGSSTTNVYAKLADTYCTMFKTCTFGFDDNDFLTPFAKAASAGECRAWVLRSLATDDTIDAGLADGSLTLDTAKLDSCLAQAKSSCSFEAFSACDGAIDGHVALGGTCRLSEQCAGDAYCKGSDLDCSDGVCTARVALGEDCSEAECSRAGGLTSCEFVDSALKCLPLELVKGAAAGAECGDVTLADKVQSVSCGAGLTCAYDEAQNKQVCVATVGEGASCLDEDQHCGAGLGCVPNADLTAATCQALTIANEGAACNEGTDPAAPIVACNLFKQLACEEGKCKKWGDGSEGTFCGKRGFTGSCKTGLFCDEQDGACHAQKQTGAACESSDECASGSCGGSGESSTCLEQCPVDGT